ncbi:MAG: hypothetical protein V1797_08685 [Pseudomonadota bacterium]
MRSSAPKFTKLYTRGLIWLIVAATALACLGPSPGEAAPVTPSLYVFPSTGQTTDNRVITSYIIYASNTRALFIHFIGDEFLAGTNGKDEWETAKILEEIINKAIGDRGPCKLDNVTGTGMGCGRLCLQKLRARYLTRPNAVLCHMSVVSFLEFDGYMKRHGVQLLANPADLSPHEKRLETVFYSYLKYLEQGAETSANIGTTLGTSFTIPSTTVTATTRTTVSTTSTLDTTSTVTTLPAAVTTTPVILPNRKDNASGPNLMLWLAFGLILALLLAIAIVLWRIWLRVGALSSSGMINANAAAHERQAQTGVASAAGELTEAIKALMLGQQDWMQAAGQARQEMESLLARFSERQDDMMQRVEPLLTQMSYQEDSLRSLAADMERLVELANDLTQRQSRLEEMMDRLKGVKS